MSVLRIMTSQYAKKAVIDLRVMSTDVTMVGITANAYIRFNTSGTVNGASVFTPGTYTWLLSGAASAYDVRYQRTGGSQTALTGVANNTWVNLGTTQTMYLSQSVSGFKDLTADVSIRYTANGTVIKTVTGCYWIAAREK